MIVFRNKKLDRFVRIFLFVAILAAITFELIRDCQRDGDFWGYVSAGRAVIYDIDIYTDYLNTWPPFFAVCSVILAAADMVSPILIRLIWLVGIVLTWYAIVAYCTSRVMGKRVSFKRHAKSLHPTDWEVLIPFLLVFRFVIDDLSNIQINTFLLASCLMVFHFFMEGKHGKSGLILGTIISLKVYPIFLLLFFVVKRQWKVVRYTLLAIVGAILITVFVFGPTQALSYHGDWIQNKAMGETIFTHKNQSLMPLLQALVTEQSRGLDIYYNIVDWSLSGAKKFSYFIIALFALIPAQLLLFDKRKKTPYVHFGEFAFVFAAIPILSPLAWKYYFVFLYPMYVFIWYSIFIRKEGNTTSRVLFYSSIALSILSTDGLLGVYLSDVLEVFGCITIATILLLATYIQVREPVPFSKSV
jgi:hypothetical protein